MGTARCGVCQGVGRLASLECMRCNGSGRVWRRRAWEPHHTEWVFVAGIAAVVVALGWIWTVAP